MIDAATRWKLVPVAILLPTVLFAAWRVQISLDDPHFAVPDHYYEQGQDWKAAQARRAASDALGWSAVLEPAAAGGSGVELRLHDREGAPVTGAIGTLAAFHNAYPAQVEECGWTETEPGVYRAELLLARAGQWRWQLQLQRGEEVWSADLRREVGAP